MSRAEPASSPKPGFWFSHHVQSAAIFHMLRSCFAKFSFLPSLGQAAPAPRQPFFSTPSKASEQNGPGSPITRDKDLANRPASQWRRALKPFLRGEAGLLLTLVIWMLFSCCCQCRIVSIRYTHMLMFPTSTHLPTLWTKVHKDV